MQNESVDKFSDYLPDNYFAQDSKYPPELSPELTNRMERNAISILLQI